MKYMAIALITFLFSFSETQEEEIWYVWIDTQVNIEDQNVRLVSSEPIRITCCVKSPKFKRFQKQTGKWIRKNYDQDFDGEAPLKNIQDKSLADTVIKEAMEKSDSNKSIRIISYSATCK